MRTNHNKDRDDKSSQLYCWSCKEAIKYLRKHNSDNMKLLYYFINGRSNSEDARKIDSGAGRLVVYVIKELEQICQ